MATKLGVAPNYFTSFVDGQGVGASSYFTYAEDFDTNFVAIKASLNDLIDEVQAVNGANFLISLDTIQFDNSSGFFGLQSQGVIGEHSYRVSINGGDTTLLDVQVGRAVTQQQRAKSDSLVNLPGSGGVGTRWVAIDVLGSPSLEITSGAQSLDIASITWDGANFTPGTLVQLAHIFFDGDEYLEMRSRPEDSGTWAGGGAARARASHKSFRLFADRVQNLERMISGRDTEVDGDALPALGFAGTSALPGLVPTNGVGTRDTSTGFFRQAANVVGFAASGAERVRLLAAGVQVVDGAVGAPSLSFFNQATTGFYRQASAVIGVAAGGVDSARFAAQGVLAAAGVAATPSLSFFGDSDTGFFSQASGAVGFASNTNERVRFTDDGILVVEGTAALPSFGFLADPNTGMFRQAADVLGFATDGVERVRITNARFGGPNGTAAAPGIGFLADSDMGMFRAGANRLGFATAGAQAAEFDALGNLDLTLQTRGEATATDFLLLTGAALRSITLDAEVRDVGESFTASSADVTIPTDGDGTYTCFLEVDFDEADSDGTPGAGNREIAIEFNGAQRGRVFQPATNATRTTLSTSFEGDLAAGQVIRARAAQDSGGTDMAIDVRLTWRKSA